MKCGSAVPARLIWVCGLNDGVFPRAETRPGFDLAWRRPTAWDRSARLEDGMAFLQALMEARETFVMSYVGQGVKDNRTIPPSVAVSQLLDYVGGRFEREKPTRGRGDAEEGGTMAIDGDRLQSIAVDRGGTDRDKPVGDRPSRGEVGAVLVKKHRLQGFSAEYFREGMGTGSYWEDVREAKSWDRANWHAARALASREEKKPKALEEWRSRGGLAGLDFEREARRTVELGVGTLAAFWGNPAQFILKRWEVAYPCGNGEEPVDQENLSLRLGPDVEMELAGREAEPDWKALARRLVEEGRYADVMWQSELLEELEEKLKEAWKGVRAPEKAPAEAAANAEYRALLELFGAAAEQEGESADAEVELEREGRRILLGASGMLVKRLGEKEVHGVISPGEHAPHKLVETWLEHLLLCASGREVVTAVVELPLGLGHGRVRRIAPVEREAARERLRGIVDMAYEEFRPLVPFWPEASMALAGLCPPKRLKKEGDAEYARRVEAERWKRARQAWRGTGWKGGNPPCGWAANRTLWGETMLDMHPDAEGVAEAFWGDFEWEKGVLGAGGGEE